MADDARLELIYSELIRTVDAQSAKLDELRGRASTVLQSTAIVTGFLGAETYAKDPGWLAGLAGLAFAIALATSAWVLRPISGWEFTNKPLTMLEDVQAGAYNDLDAMHAFLVESWEPKIASNETKLDDLSMAILIGVIALGAEAVLLFFALATR